MMRQLKNLEDAIEKINKMEELEIIIKSTKRKLSAIEKKNKINELEED